MEYLFEKYSNLRQTRVYFTFRWLEPNVPIFKYRSTEKPGQFGQEVGMATDLKKVTSCRTNRMPKFIVKAILKLKEAGRYSFYGLKAAFQDEFAFRLELLAGAIALPIAFFIGRTYFERALLISSLLIVFVAELLNSAIETTLNRIDSTWNPLTKKAKDLGSAAVFITIINALVVWIMMIISRVQT